MIHTDFKAVDKRDELSSVFGYLRGDHGNVPLVLDHGKPYGVLNERALARTRLDPREHIGSFVVGTRTLAPDATIEDALDVIATSHIPVVPVTRKGKELVGYVTALDLLDAIAAPRGARAAELAREAPVLTKSASVGEALHEMQRTGAPAIPVVREDGRLLGLVTRRRLLPLMMDARPDGRKPPGSHVDARAGDIAGYVEADVETVLASATFEDVRDALKRGGVAVVLAPDGAPRGILTPEGVAAAVSQRGRT